MYVCFEGQGVDDEEGVKRKIEIQTSFIILSSDISSPQKKKKCSFPLSK